MKSFIIAADDPNICPPEIFCPMECSPKDQKDNAVSFLVNSPRHKLWSREQQPVKIKIH